jgi:hypothetical protein
MSGGGGADVFVLASSGTNTISDFESKIDAVDFTFRFETGQYGPSAADVYAYLVSDGLHVDVAAYNISTGSSDIIAHLTNLAAGEETAVRILWHDHQEILDYGFMT